MNGLRGQVQNLNKMEINELNNYFQRKDIEHLNKHKKIYRYTKDGVFAPTDLNLLRKLFERLNLSTFQNFIDLGAGDGRVVFLASLFTKASGIEKDEDLYTESKESKILLNAACELINEDYLNVDLTSYDIIFIAPDSHFYHGLEEKLQRELNGLLVVNSPLYLPRFLKQKERIIVDGMTVSVYEK